jgi:hypothetical protein
MRIPFFVQALGLGSLELQFLLMALTAWFLPTRLWFLGAANR